MNLHSKTNGPEKEIRRRINQEGTIRFDQFMEIALYWPNGGYYRTGIPVGTEGDFYTSAYVHPVFGALIAQKLFHMWQSLLRPDLFWVLELGAGSGRLARDVINSSSLIDDNFARALCYVGLDYRAPYKYPEIVDWVVSNSLPFSEFSGVILANELMDAMPVRRVVQHKGCLVEMGVGISEKGNLIDVFMTNPPVRHRRTKVRGVP